MGNVGSNNSNGRRGNNPTLPPPQPLPEVNANRYVFARLRPYYHNPTAAYYPPPPAAPPLPAPYDHHHRVPIDPAAQAWVGGRYPCGPEMHPTTAYIDHQIAIPNEVKNEVNLKRETLKIVPDEQNPGKFLVNFTYDASVAGSISLYFFAKEVEECNMITTKENLLSPITFESQQGLGLKFRQESGTGIDFSMFDESEVIKVSETGVYPLVIKAEATQFISEDGNVIPCAINSQLTQAVFEKKRGEYQVRVSKQILWVNEIRYEQREIYGNDSISTAEVDRNDPGKECFICLSQPRDTTVLPCRHMCMCSGCAKVLRRQTNRCPICKQPVDSLLKFEKKQNGVEDRWSSRYI
ncbi:probable E3 ubiquitin-protein ligase LOG2 [Rutidosis leptorrhynchoides]|uniref:probable E3 ubiquitin-protein ligase LOG2 n=1 Tax=Rutidosis leptorrhynchoides TaxID=125765 RepID=UPI003A9A0979